MKVEHELSVLVSVPSSSEALLGVSIADSSCTLKQNLKDPYKS